MYKIAIIVFRECLEIVLLLGIIGAVTKQVPRAKYLILLGTILGLGLSAIFALSAASLAKVFNSFSNELMQVGIIVVTILLITWTVVWMKGHGAKVKQEFSELSVKISQGSINQFMLVSVCAIVIMREAIEIILFIYSIAKTDKISQFDYMLGAASGGAAGLIVGISIYYSLVKINPAYMFKVCSSLLILIAASLSTKLADIAASAGAAMGLDQQLWDSSWLINNDSLTGKFMHALVGYQARPNLLQILCYSLTIIMIILLKNNNIKKVDQK